MTLKPKKVIADLTRLNDGYTIGADYKRTNKVRAPLIRIKETFNGFDGVSAASTSTNDTPKYAIAKRFDFMEKLVDMVIKEICPSCIITGPGGIGKTYTVTKAIEKAGLSSNKYVHVKGFTTPLGLYMLLHDNRQSLIVFDDCDSAFKDPTALNILKSALDSSEERIISWNSSRLEEEIESSFEFKGRIIFISNIPLKQFAQPLISRSMIIDLQMTRDEIIDRINSIAYKINPNVSENIVNDVVNFLKTKKNDIKDLNIRTFIKVLKIRMYNAEEWTEMADFMACV